MRAHCPNYNEASYFFELKGAEVFAGGNWRLDDSGAAPRARSKRSAKGSSALRRHRESGKTKETTGGKVGGRETVHSPRERRSFPSHSWYRPIFLASSHDSFIPRRMRSDRRSLPASSPKTPARRVILFGPLRWVHAGYAYAGPFGFHCSLLPC